MVKLYENITNDHLAVSNFHSSTMYCADTYDNDEEVNQWRENVILLLC